LRLARLELETKRREMKQARGGDNPIEFLRESEGPEGLGSLEFEIPEAGKLETVRCTDDPLSPRLEVDSAAHPLHRVTGRREAETGPGAPGLFIVPESEI
jgi:hypothetical protein